MKLYAKRNLFFVIFLAVSLAAAGALEVDQSELKSAAGEDAIVFENYSGPHSVINTAAEISSIGTNLGAATAKNPDSSSTAGSSDRYSIIHAVDPSEKGKLDADIFIIGSEATVDHIDNVRRIIAAYLSAAYGYSSADAKTIATFVTVYNAVYRGKMDAWNSKYKSVVTKNLSSSKCGIAISYREWPGNTQLVIPLSDVHGGLSSVDTSIISDKQVVTSMQGEKDKGVDSRKQMVDIKEREADNASTKAQTSQKQAATESAKLKDDQAKNQTAQKEAVTAKKEADTAKTEAADAQKKADANPNDKQAQKDAEQKQAAADQKQQTADQKQAAAETQQKKTDEQAQKTETAQQNAASAQETADKKRDEAQSERTTIAQDQQTVMQETAANESAPSAVGLKAVDDLGVLSGLVKINTNTGSVIEESPVTVIRSRTVCETANNYIAIAGEAKGIGAVRIVQIDKKTMAMKKQGQEAVSDLSVLVENGGSYYCVIQDGKNWVLGKYNENLELQLKSPVNVKPATPITVTANGILVTASDGKARLLKTADLTMVTESDSVHAK
jgi:hypothetical protein